MKCCGCNKNIEIDEEENGIPSWYGKYLGCKCIKVICSECIKDDIKKKEYVK